MKYLLVIFVLGLSILTCSSDNDNLLKEDNLNTSYVLNINGKTISSNSSIPLEMLLDSSDVAMSINVEESDDLFTMTFSNIPTRVGSISLLDSEDNILIAITGTRTANYSSFSQIFIDSGTMTRTADNKVTFSGTFEFNGTTYDATGFIKSDGIKNH